MIKCNGQRVTNYTFSEVDQYTTRVTFGTQDGIGNVKEFGTEPLEPGDYLAVCIMGYDNAASGPGYITHDDAIKQTSSHPTTQYFDGTGAESYVLTHDFQKTNPYTAIVEIDGIRLCPPEGIEYTADGSSDNFPLVLGNWKGSEVTFQSFISDNDIHVFVDNGDELRLYVDFTLTSSDGESIRQVVLTETPEAGTDVKIFVDTAADYKINYSGTPISDDNKIRFDDPPRSDQRVVITSDNDTSELDLINRVYKGPTTIGFETVIGYDAEDFDKRLFDESIGSSSDLSIFNLGRVIVFPDRLQVTVNGLRKYYGEDWELFNIRNQQTTSIRFLGNPIDALDVVVVRMQSENIVPDNLTFSLFKDMRDNNAIYNNNKSHVTTLTEAVTADADTIKVLDTSKLTVPDLTNNQFGIVMIDAERITYREIDLVNHTISGLRRGTAGTAANSHEAGTLVADYSVTTYLDYDYDKAWYEQDIYNDGSSVTNGKSLQNSNTVPANFLKGR